MSVCVSVCVCVCVCLCVCVSVHPHVCEHLHALKSVTIFVYQHVCMLLKIHSLIMK